MKFRRSNLIHASSMLVRILLAVMLGLLIGCDGGGQGAATPVPVAKATLPEPEGIAGGHFDAKGRLPTQYTRERQQALRESLPFSDQRDFEEDTRGFIAAPGYTQIMADNGTVAWDMGRYEFLSDDEPLDSVNPSLQRQARLNMAYGLYEVVPGRIYQLRGFDISNMSLVRGDTGWILFDVLTSKETARAALKFANEQLGERPVVAIVYSHSHVDHFGGVRGVVDEADVKAGKVQILAPMGFMEHAVAENIYAGNAMSRRADYQYGVLLPASPYGHVDQSIGKRISIGQIGLLAPTRIITAPIEEVTIDGVTMVFQNTPGTEAPAEMNTWFPQFKAFWAAENITGTIHNIYTLRGALVRDALAWSKYINQALYRFGNDAEVMFAAHTWPRWGNERIREVMRGQRDMYAHLNNAVLHLANQGVTINQMQNVYKVPESLQRQWFARGYHGAFEYNSRAVINRYLGYWDANPATLIPLSPADSAPLYVEMMGGAQKIIDKGSELFLAGEYLLAQEILNKLLYAQPQNQQVKDLLADVWEQIGYQQESPSVRNSFLAAALELRHGIPEGATPNTASADMALAVPTALYLDYLGVLLDPDKAVGMAFTINLRTPDNSEEFVLEMSNSTLTNAQGFQAVDADFTVSIPSRKLLAVLLGATTFDALVQAGEATIEGDQQVFQQLRSALDTFPPHFELLPGTAGAPVQEG